VIAEANARGLNGIVKRYSNDPKADREGLRPLCYPDDVAPYMIEGYRTKHGIPKE
jgi:hypothetical protein